MGFKLLFGFVKTTCVTSLSFLLLLSSCSTKVVHHFDAPIFFENIDRVPAFFTSDKPETCNQHLLSLIKGGFSKDQLGVLETLSRLDEADRKAVYDLIDGVYFVDYYSYAQKVFYQASEGNWEDLKKAKIAYSYDEYHENGSAFSNFRKARSYIEKEPNPFTLEALKNTHKLMMEGGIENLRSYDLGAIRPYSVAGNASQGRWILTDEQIQVVSENPYLKFEKSYEQNGQQLGRILYPAADSVKDEALSLIRETHSETFQKIEWLQKSLKRGNAPPQDEIDELTEELVGALLEERMMMFQKNYQALLPVDSPKKLDAFISLVARQHRDLISIHPFVNGNGRTMRLAVLYQAFASIGLPPPRLLDPNNDMLAPLKEWEDEIRQGLLSSTRLYRDLAERAEMGLSFEHSPELLSPLLPSDLALILKKEGTKKIVENAELVGLDSRQFLVYFNRRLGADTGLRQNMHREPVEVLKKVSDEYLEYRSQYQIKYDHKKSGLEDVAVNYVDLDFVEVFAKNFSSDPIKWRRKLEMWYKPVLNWRGLASLQRQMKESEILSLFKNPSHHMTSNWVLRNSEDSSSEALTRATIQDFERYNKALFEDNLFNYAMDHSRSGPLYSSSFGYSTSKNREVGKAFAMGAMVVADYGKHRTPEAQARIQSRVLVAAYQAKKDLDLTRYRQIDDRFSNMYGRQQEVMGIGMADPDSVMLAQTIDAKGDVILSYVRDIDNPNTVWVVEGDFRPEQGIPTKERIVTTHIIN